MTIRKNTRRFDPRYFMDEKTDVVKEAYEPGRAVGDMPQYNDEPDEEGAYDTGEERISPDELQEEEVQDLADKFDVEATVETASDGKTAILVWHKNGDVSAYHDGEEMYQDLASRMEMSEGLENVTPENIQIAVEAFKQVAMNLAPAVVLPALMMAYKELKMSKKE